MLTISEAAERVQATRERLYNAIKRGELAPAINKPRHVLIDAEELARWAALPVSKGGRPRKEKEGAEEHGG